MSMTLSALIEVYAGYERRALLLYRRLAERFAGDRDASGRWRAMSDAEARHFTTLQLATDRLAIAGGGTIGVEADVTAIDTRLSAIEQAAADATLSPAQAVLLTLEWEEGEVERITGLLAALPEPVRARVRAGVLGDIDGHYTDLGALLAAAGRPDLEGRLHALRTAASL
jgi:rubrerythrin